MKLKEKNATSDTPNTPKRKPEEENLDFESPHVPKKLKRQPSIFEPSIMMSQSTFDHICKDYIVESILPFTHSETKPFKKLCQRMHPTKSVPGYLKIHKLMSDDFTTMRANLKKIFDEQENVSIATDGWTGARKSFLGYTITWLDSEFNRHIALVGCRRFFGRHTFDRLAKHISDMLIEYSVEMKTGGITTDGAKNYEKSFKVFASNDPSEQNQIDIELENPETEMDLDDFVNNSYEVVFNIRCFI